MIEEDLNLERLHRRLITKALWLSDNVKEAADKLGLGYNTLQKRMGALKISMWEIKQYKLHEKHKRYKVDS